MSVPTPRTSREAYLKKCLVGVVSEAIAASPSSAQCLASGISDYGCEIFNYILPVSPSRHPRRHDQSNLTALLGARAVPTASFYRWENQVTELLHEPPTVTREVCRQPGTGSPNIRSQPPAMGHHLPWWVSIPPQARRVSEKQLPAAGLACEPPPWGSAGQGVPVSRGRGQNLLWGQAVFWKGCPQAVLLMAVVAPLTPAQPQKTTRAPGWPGFRAPALTKFPAPCRLFQLLFSTGLQANGPGELQRSWKKANFCLTKSRRVDRLQERWAFLSAPESTQSRPALASLDDLQLLLVL